MSWVSGSTALQRNGNPFTKLDRLAFDFICLHNNTLTTSMNQMLVYSSTSSASIIQWFGFCVRSHPLLIYCAFRFKLYGEKTSNRDISFVSNKLTSNTSTKKERKEFPSSFLPSISTIRLWRWEIKFLYNSECFEEYINKIKSRQRQSVEWKMREHLSSGEWK